MVILDSNVIIRVMRGDENTFKVVEEFQDTIATTVFNVYEILRSKFGYKVREHIEKMVIYPFTASEALIASDIYRELASRGKIKEDIDVLIASIVKSNNEVLITYDKDFEDIKKITGINIITL
ncbi:hypothetical protein SUSAZ_02375 [Sulfolobus acidocaldarius SUSAZ]|nr:hypothetical protein SUSAZ_02375 [Sulfolobus acidocaldarius SUSAZ]